MRNIYLVTFLLMNVFIWCPGPLKAQELKDPSVTLELRDGGYIEILEAEGADISEVLQKISQKSSYPIKVEGEIRGRVDIFLTDIDVLSALRIILEKLDLAFSEGTEMIDGKEQKSIRVMPESVFEQQYGQAFGKKIQTRIIPLVYLKAQDLMDTLNQLKTPSGKIIYNEETNSFILIDHPDTLASMEKVIKELDVPMESKEIALQNADAAEVAKKVTEKLTAKVGRVEVNAEKNSLLVTDRLSNVQEIERLIRILDTVKEIQIDVKVIQIILSDEHETGVDWEAIVSTYQSLPFDVFDTPRLAVEENKISMGTISAEDLVILTEALETVGAIKTVFVDELMTQSNGKAQFLIPVQEIARVEEDHTQVGFELREGDVKFVLSPQWQEDNAITVEIQPSVYVVVDENGQQKPRKNILIRSVAMGADIIKSATRVLPGIGDGEERERGLLAEEKAQEPVIMEVENGATIVIGSMLKEVFVKSLRKIPLLGDLPILGFAFQSEGEQLRNTEIIVFLTVNTISP
ncbi:MAG TPA: secretin N-terminal domain-containing protein [Candidatus Omnitrophota bacterium]|nr:secretin N-terminal domain-containing protein [Candidatus Omnitrophota bacterium]